MYCVRLSLPGGATQVIVATLPTPPLDLSDELFGAVLAGAVLADAASGTPHAPRAEAPVVCMTPQQIAGAVEAALDHYHSWSVLSDNPLTRMLNLDRFRQAKDNPLFADGLALRRAIDAAMDAIAALPLKRHARLVHYFRMRYVEGASQQDVAGTMDRSERTAARVKKQLVERVAHELLRIAAPNVL